MSDQFFIRSSGQIRGPFTWDQILDLRKRGRLQPFHEVSSDRVSWATASSLPDLFPPQAVATQTSVSASPEPSFFIDRDGQRQGPYTRDQLAALMQSGVLNAESNIWTSGQAGWRALGQSFPEMFGQSSPFQFSSGSSRTGLWKGARVGITLTIVGTGIFAGTVAMFCLAGLIAVSNAHAGTANLLQAIFAIGLLVLISRLLVFVAQILETVGFGFCTTAPARSGARGLAIATLVTAIANLLLDFIYFVSILSGGAGIGSESRDDWVATSMHNGYLEALILISAFAYLAYRFLYLLFLRAAAAACRSASLAQSIVYLMIVYCVLVFLAFMTFLVGFLYEPTPRSQGPVALVAMVLVLFLLGVAWLAWYIVVLFQCHSALGRDGI